MCVSGPAAFKGPAAIYAFSWLNLGEECGRSTLAYPSSALESLSSWLLFGCLWTLFLSGLSLGQAVCSELSGLQIIGLGFVSLEVSCESHGSVSLENWL